MYVLYTHGLSQNIRWPIREVNVNCHLGNFLIALLHITPIALDSHDTFMLLAMVTSTLTSDSWSEHFDLEEGDGVLHEYVYVSCIKAWHML